MHGIDGFGWARPHPPSSASSGEILLTGVKDSPGGGTQSGCMKSHRPNATTSTPPLQILRNCFRGDWLLGAASLTLIACSASSGSESADEDAPDQARQALTPSSIDAAKVNLASVVAAAPRPALVVSGTWSTLPTNTVTNTTNNNIALLSDGTLLAQSGGNWHTWSKFTPRPAATPLEPGQRPRPALLGGSIFRLACSRTAASSLPVASTSPVII